MAEWKNHLTSHIHHSHSSFSPSPSSSRSNNNSDHDDGPEDHHRYRRRRQRSRRIVTMLADISSFVLVGVSKFHRHWLSLSSFSTTQPSASASHHTHPSSTDWYRATDNSTSTIIMAPTVTQSSSSLCIFFYTARRWAGGDRIHNHRSIRRGWVQYYWWQQCRSIQFTRYDAAWYNDGLGWNRSWWWWQGW